MSAHPSILTTPCVSSMLEKLDNCSAIVAG